jgi:hypothetical protein
MVNHKGNHNLNYLRQQPNCLFRMQSIAHQMSFLTNKYLGQSSKQKAMIPVSLVKVVKRSGSEY